MKRLLLLLIGVMLLLPGQVRAIAPNTVGTLTSIAVSPGVRRTLERVSIGIENAWQESSLLMFLESMTDEWSSIALNALRIDPQWTATSRGLQNITACQRTDLFLLEEAMLNIQENMKAAIEENEVLATLRLAALAKYVDKRYSTLANFGTDPLEEDFGWGEPQLFDSINYVDDGEPVCYFTTDYLPPVTTGTAYGCKASMLEVLVARLNQLPEPEHGLRLQNAIALELRGMRGMESALQQSLVSADDLLSVQREIEELEGQEPSEDTPVASFVPDQSTAEPITGCQDFLPSGVWLRAPSGPFSLEKNNLELLTTFRGVRRQEGTTRPLPSFLRGDDEPEYEAPFVVALGVLGNDNTEEFGRYQGQSEADTFGTGIDAVLSMERSLRFFNVSVGKLGTLATQMDGGIRGFVRDFAYFLRRSCLDRACSERLDVTLKLLYANECFPHTNGTYLTAGDTPQAQRCLDAAGL